jgi:hypothetical protein
MRTAFATLKDWFKDGFKFIESGNQLQHFYVEASNPSSSDFEKRKKLLLSDPEGLILLAYGKNFSVAHSFKQFGGTLHRPEDKIVCLLGLEEYCVQKERSDHPPRLTKFAFSRLRLHHLRDAEEG